MISVIIPAYNCRISIAKAIDSVLAQTFTDYEIIVVDDGSTDGTADIIKVYGSAVKYLYQQNSGAGLARNNGIAASKGDWIAFLDADDEWLPNKLKLQMELLARNPELRWCASIYHQSDGRRFVTVTGANAVKKALCGRDYFENYFRAATLGLCRIITTVIVVRKDVFDHVGVFDTNLLRGQDVELWWRIAHHFPKIGYVAESLATIHLNLDNPALTRRRLEAKRGAIERVLVPKHLKLAQQQGSLSVFTLFAKKLIRKSLVTTIYHGFADDARTTVKQFKQFFPWHWRFGTYVLTLFPRAASALLRAAAYVGYVLKLDRQVTRRWIYNRQTAQNKQANR